MSASECASCSSSGAVGSAVAAALQFFAATQCLLGEPWPQQAQLHNGSSFDFIVVGAGTAGSTLAARLTEANFNVLLLEAGGDPPQEAIVPGFRNVLKNTPYDWNFTTVDDHFSSQALLGGSQRQPRGRMLGGSGSINDMVYARGFPVDYDEWASIVGDEWKWEAVLKYFLKTEYMTDENIIHDRKLMKYHGTSGEIEVSGQKEVTHTTERFLFAFQELGFKLVKDMTYPHLIGAGRFSHTIRNGQRDSSLTALLNKAAERDNLHVLKDALVTKVLSENNTVQGVQVQIDENVYQFYANKEVILSAGTFNTAKLLLLSGIGPKEHLEELGIEVVQDLPVGDNLHDHVMVLTYLAAENGTCYTSTATSHMDIIKYLYDRTGSLSISDSMGAYFALNSSRKRNVPDFAIYPTCIPVNSSFYEGCIGTIGFNDDICRKLEEENKNYELLSLAVVLLKPKSRGRVRLSSLNPFDVPLIYSGTFTNLEDLDNYSEAMKVAWSLANTSYFSRKNARVVNLPIGECSGLEGPEELKCRVKALATSAWHAVGTAAMGTVVDSKLAVKGLLGLRVVDASVMPKVIRGNTNAPVVMIAERAADFIKEVY